jgi:hypothetical protein
MPAGIRLSRKAFWRWNSKPSAFASSSWSPATGPQPSLAPNTELSITDLILKAYADVAPDF